MNSKYFILLLVLFLFNASTVFYIINYTGIPFISKRSILIYSLLFLLTILITIVLYKAKKGNWKIEKIFLFFGLILGSFYSIIIPVGNVPDEAAHFWRVYEISELKIFPETDSEGNTGIYIPNNLKKSVHVFSKYDGLIGELTTQASDSYDLEKTPADSYSPLNYIPQTIGVWISKILNLPIIPTIYISRVFNMIICVIVLYYCIKYIPIMKKIVFLIAMLPMTMQLISSVSADGSIICAGTALITFVLYSQKKMKRLINWRDLLLLLTLCLILVISKPMYALLCPILFWIPKARFSSNKHKIITIISIGIISFSLVLVRLFLTPTEAKFDSSIQYNFILSNPINYLLILFSNAILAPEQFINSTIGKNLEWFSVELYSPYILTIFILFVILCLEHETKIKGSFKAFAFFSFFSIVFATFSAMFIQWTTPGETIIEGVQGRYFIPILLLIPLACLPTNNPTKKHLVKPYLIYAVMAFVNAYALTTIFCSHL